MRTDNSIIFKLGTKTYCPCNEALDSNSKSMRENERGCKREIEKEQYKRGRESEIYR